MKHKTEEKSEYLDVYGRLMKYSPIFNKILSLL